MLWIFLIASTIGLAQTDAEEFAYNLKLAEQGDATAQYNVGVFYQKGRGTTKNINKAFEWYQKSANKGFAPAQYNLGTLYFHGEGVALDRNKSFELYQKAANQNFVVAQYNMGLCYLNGDGVTKDYAKAVEWFQKAANQNYALAQFNLGICYQWGFGVQINSTKSFEWLSKAANQGLAAAQYEVALCYYFGKGIPKDGCEAIIWAKKAADQGYAKAGWNDNAADLLSQFIFEGICPDNNNTTPTNSNTKPNRQETKPTTNKEPTSPNNQAKVNTDIPPKVNQPPQTTPKQKQPVRRFNSPARKQPFGISFGYTQKQWVYREGQQETKMGSFDNQKSLSGWQGGIRFEPLFNYGFGFNTGLFYELYYSHLTNNYGTAYFFEHCVHIPANLEYRFYCSEVFSVFIYGGASADIGIAAKYTEEDNNGYEIYSTTDFYGDDDDVERLNYSYEYGGGMRYKIIQLNIGISRGIRDMSNNYKYKLKQNKNIMASLSIMF